MRQHFPGDPLRPLPEGGAVDDFAVSAEMLATMSSPPTSARLLLLRPSLSTMDGLDDALLQHSGEDGNEEDIFWTGIGPAPPSSTDSLVQGLACGAEARGGQPERPLLAPEREAGIGIGEMSPWPSSSSLRGGGGNLLAASGEMVLSALDGDGASGGLAGCRREGSPRLEAGPRPHPEALLRWRGAERLAADAPAQDEDATARVASAYAGPEMRPHPENELPLADAHRPLNGGEYIPAPARHAPGDPLRPLPEGGAVDCFATLAGTSARQVLWLPSPPAAGPDRPGVPRCGGATRPRGGAD